MELEFSKVRKIKEDEGLKTKVERYFIKGSMVSDLITVRMNGITASASPMLIIVEAMKR